MDQVTEWPSKRIPHGGVFHVPKVKYSPETQDLLKTLMQESKISMQRQQQVNWCLRNGNSLADIKNKSKPQRVQSAPAGSKSQPKISRRRSYSAIKKSGDFERDKFVSNQKNEDREVVKNRLQNIMEFGKDHDYMTKVPKSEKKVNVPKKKIPGKYEVLQDLLSRIKERSDWLKEMEATGEGARHRETIKHQIAELMRTIDSLNLPKNLKDLKIDDDESSSAEKKDNNDSETSRTEHKDNNDSETSSTARSEKKSSGKNSVRFKDINPNGPAKRNIIYKKRENIADILYPAK